jgi:ubiquinone/menaquinone biosynthesis C-methylase UbiE
MHIQMNSFEYHWEINNSAVPPTKLAQARSFLKILCGKFHGDQKVNVLDAGCGDGAHAAVIGEFLREFNYTGIDISQQAIAKCRLAFKDHYNIRFEIGDIYDLKYDDDCFDIVFSYGVIAYMPDPQKALRELSRVVRPNGLIGIWVYPKPKRISYHFLILLRFILIKLPLFISTSLLNALVPFIGMMPTNSKVSLKNASFKQCREILMVNLLPPHLIFPTEDEVAEWFKASNTSITCRDADMPISIWGKK